jgi:uncharacterized protein YjgD (DUF1641 family)
MFDDDGPRISFIYKLDKDGELPVLIGIGDSEIYKRFLTRKQAIRLINMLSNMFNFGIEL